MHKIIATLLAAMLLLGMLAIPAAADETYDALVQAVADAEAEVAYWEGQVTLAAQELADAEAALLAAEQARQPYADAVEEAQADLTEAEAELAAALIVQQTAQSTLDAIDCSGLTGQTRAACNHTKQDAEEELALANADVEAKDAAVQQAADDLQAAQLALEPYDQAVTDAAADVADATQALADANAQLGLAEADLILARAALEAYVPPTDPHAGCKGIANAQQQVVKTSNGKGKSVETLAVVAGKLGC